MPLPVGAQVGAWFALSGFPVHFKVLGGGSGGAIGWLTLEEVERLSHSHGTLALKALKLIGIGATSTKESDEDVSASLNLGTKMAEVLFRNKIRDVEAKAEVQTEERDKAVHDKERNAMLMRKLQRAHQAATDKCADLQKEVQRRGEATERLEATLRKREKAVESLTHRVEHLSTQLEVQHSEAMQMAAVVKLQGQLEERDRLVAELSEALEVERREADEELEEWKVSCRSLQVRSKAIYASAQARFRWRIAHLLVVLDRKVRQRRPTPTHG